MLVDWGCYTGWRGWHASSSSLCLRRRRRSGRRSGQADDQEGESGYLLDKILDQSGQKGTGKWTVQEAANVGIAVPTISAALEARFLSARKEERVQCEAFYAAKQVRTRLPHTRRAAHARAEGSRFAGQSLYHPGC